MAPPPKRKKQAGPRSGYGSLSWIGSRKIWVVLGFQSTPTGKVRRPILHRFDDRDDTGALRIQTRGQAEGAFALYIARKRKAAALNLRAACRDVRGLVAAYLAAQPEARALYRSAAQQWATMQGDIRLDEYLGDHFRAFRDALDALAADGDLEVGTRTREGVNAKLKAICLIVAWAVSQRMVEPELHSILRAVEPLRKGRSLSPEGEGRIACTIEQFNAMLECLPDRWFDVALIQRWGGGARPSEILSLRRDELQKVDGLWMATKTEHKTAGKGVHREIVFAPADGVNGTIERLLAECTDADPYLFSPRRWEAQRHRLQGRRDDAATNGTLGDYPDHSAYRKAGAGACRAYCEGNGLRGDAAWQITPYQICHMRLNEIALKLSKEHARATRGHTSAVMTANYTKDADADNNRRLAIAAAMVGAVE